MTESSPATPPITAGDESIRFRYELYVRRSGETTRTLLETLPTLARARHRAALHADQHAEGLRPWNDSLEMKGQVSDYEVKWGTYARDGSFYSIDRVGAARKEG